MLLNSRKSSTSTVPWQQDHGHMIVFLLLCLDVFLLFLYVLFLLHVRFVQVNCVCISKHSALFAHEMGVVFLPERQKT